MKKLLDKAKAMSTRRSASQWEYGQVSVPCYPLDQVLKAIGRSVVDYWSLDTEGSEVKILNATDFDAIEVGLITVEHQRKRPKRNAIHTVLESRGFKRVRCDNLDDLYASTAYLAKRGIHVPRKYIARTASTCGK